MKKGFTLIEMIAVVGIIALMSFMILPAILNQVGNKKEDISEATEKIIFDAAELYLTDNISTYPKTVGSKYCIKLEQLMNAKYLKKPFTDIKTGKEINTNRIIKIIVNSYNEYDSYELLKEKQTCE